MQLGAGLPARHTWASSLDQWQDRLHDELGTLDSDLVTRARQLDDSALH